MVNFIYAYIASFITMVVIDAFWLGVIAPTFYKKHIGFIMADKPNWMVAGIFYLIFIAGLTYFVVYPAMQANYGLVRAGLTGALFGLVTYATYDLTNQATLKNWPVIVTIVDLVWGALLCTVVSVIAVLFLKIIAK